MKSLNSFIGEHLTWVQPKAIKHDYELRDQSEVYGRLVFPKSFGTLAEIESAEGKWTLKRVGFIHTSVTIREDGKEENVGVFKPSGWGSRGTLELTSGKKYEWKLENFWATRFEIKDSSGNTVIKYQSGKDDSNISDMFKNQARVSFTEQARNLPELSQLILIGWYLIVMIQMDSVVGVA
ncbi:MAG: hypothetical protein V1720_08330 [bacterium]